MALQRETLSLSGAAPDPFPQDAPASAWNSVQNVFFRNGESIRAGGDKAVFSVESAPPLTLQYTELFGTPYWVYATGAGVFVTDGVTRSDITPAGWAAPVADEVFTSCVIGGLVVVNGSARDPVWWPGLTTSPCEPLPGWPSGGRCIAMRTHKSFLFAIGRQDVSANFVAWSSAADPGAVPDEWTPSASNLAGFLTLSPGVDPCLEGRTLRDSFLIYKGESVWSLDFVADTSVVFQARKIFSHTGIAGTKAIGGDHQRHVYIDRMGDIYATDGTMAQSILDGLSQRFFYAELAERPQGRLIGASLAREKMAVLGYPMDGDDWATRAAMVDLATLDVGWRDLPQASCIQEGRYVDVPEDPSWDAATGAWDDDARAWNAAFSGVTTNDLVCGTAIGGGGFVLLEADGAADFLDGPVAASALKEGLSFGDGDRRKLITRVWPRFRGGQGALIRVRVGGQEIEGGPVEWTAPIAWTAGQETPVDCLVTGRFMALEVASLGGEPWVLSSLDVVWRRAGRW